MADSCLVLKILGATLLRQEIAKNIRKKVKDMPNNTSLCNWHYCAASGCYEKLYSSATYCSKHNTSVTLANNSAGTSITTTRNQRSQLADELNEYVDKTGKEWEYRIEVDSKNNTKFGLIARPHNK